MDVSDDLLPKQQVNITKSLDDVELTRYRAHSVTVSLKDVEGKYSPDLAGNFWETNNLNPGGYQEEIKVYRESFISDMWVESLLFVGVIEGQAEQFSAVQVNITAKDISVELERSFISDFGVLSKYDSLRQQSDEATFEGVYVPEGSLLPIQPEVAKAWSDRTELTLRRLQLPTQGPPLPNAAHLTASDFRTSGGFCTNAADSECQNLTAIGRRYVSLWTVGIDGYCLQYGYTTARGCVGHSNRFQSWERAVLGGRYTRITRLVTDWVHDATNDRLLMPLSNPEGHIADVLVQYDLEIQTVTGPFTPSTQTSR